MSATSAPFLLLYLQNAFTSLPFVLTFLPLLLLTGAWLPLLVALVLAVAVHLLFNSFANPLSAPTAREAVLITGCSSGLGEATALHLASIGYTVFATVRKEADGQALVRSAGRSSQRIVYVLIDVTQQQSVDAAVAEVSSRIANERLSLRVLINNVGAVVGKGFCGLEVLPPALLEQSCVLNATAHLRVTQAFLPLLRATAGRGERARIVFTSSVSAALPVPCLGSYAVAKAALEVIADCLRMELRATGIELCVVRPGDMDTSTKRDVLQRDGTPSIDDMAAANPHVDRSVLTYYDNLNTAFHHTQQSRGMYPVSQLTRVHEHIVRARWVQARYLCGSDAVLGVNVLRRLPEQLRDYVLLWATTGSAAWKK